MLSNKKTIFRGPFQTSLSRGTLTGPEKDLIICYVLGETEVRTEMGFESSLAWLWKTERSRLYFQKRGVPRRGESERTSRGSFG